MYRNTNGDLIRTLESKQFYKFCVPKISSAQTTHFDRNFVTTTCAYLYILMDFHGIALTITKMIDFYSRGIFTFCLPPFSIEMNQNVNP